MVCHEDQAEANDGRILFRDEIKSAISGASSAILSSADTVLGTCFGLHEVSKLSKAIPSKLVSISVYGRTLVLGRAELSVVAPMLLPIRRRRPTVRDLGTMEEFKGRGQTPEFSIDEVGGDYVDLGGTVSVGGYGTTGAELEDFNPSVEWGVRLGFGGSLREREGTVWSCHEGLVALMRRLR